jgi:hypothetical protein
MGALGDAIGAYTQPLVDMTDGSMEQLRKALAVGQACWNLAIMPEESRRSVVDGMRDSLGMSDAEFDEFERDILWPMVRRHEEMFPGLHDRQSLLSPHWDDLPPAPVNRPRREGPVAPGRYDPCPCNSGKKYKFCCGRGRG